MIRFACTCGHGFEVDDGEAGGMIQCTRCGRLNDVPNHSDLLSLAPDGTYSLDQPASVDEPDRMADLHLVYARTTHDGQGDAIDLRTLPAGRRGPRGGDADADEAGELDLAPSAADEPVKARPRYDPETGELIRELALQRDPERPIDPSKIPMAKAAINYASGHLARRVSPLRVAAELVMPLNLAVMSFVLLAHLFNALLFVASVPLIFLWPVLLMMQAVMLAHYGNVVDETGREERDELPRPLRDFSFYDDMWAPFVQVFGGLMIAYVPPVAVASYLPGPELVWLLLALGIGTVVAPAVLLTTTTSGATNNLRPDRVLAVMRISGLHYVGAVLLWAVAWPVYALGWFGVCLCLVNAFGIAGGDLGLFGEWLVVLPALVAGIYLMHFFSWHMGLVYRAHHDEFPWILQRHVRDPNAVRPQGTHADRLGRRRVGRADPVLPPTGQRRAAPIKPVPVLPVAPGAPVQPGVRRAGGRGDKPPYP